MNHPQGITTNELQQYLTEKASKLNIIDVREPEEVEMGKLFEAKFIHYPDVLNDPKLAIEKEKETILLCYSGNRSSELCNTLTGKGFPCKFVMGGYEKWIAEGNSIEEVAHRDDLRAIADYPNKNVLLDTPEVKRLVSQEDAIFVDVRYPGDFELGHLPDAFNIPIRKLTIVKSGAQINTLPQRPIVAACYDKRSCFYSLIIGLRLYRQGYDYRGRYTVPHEYVQPLAEKEYVKVWNKNNDLTLLGQMSVPLKQLLQNIYSKVGNLPLAIFLTVFLLRLLVSPLAVKEERDQAVFEKITPQLQELKDKAGSNRKKYSHSIMKLYRKNCLTPAFNLCGTLIQILIFILLFRVVSQISRASSESFLWLSSLANQDPYFIFPFLVAGLIGVTIRLNLSNKKIYSLIFQIIVSILLFLLLFRLSAGVNLYLIFSLLLILLQKQMVTQYLEKKPASRRDFKPIYPTKVVFLKNAHQFSEIGTKASRLSRLMESGFPVPRGFVIPSLLLTQNQAHFKLSAKHWQEINRLWRKLQLNQVAVRSSGINEDGAIYSYAGMYTSVLNVGWCEFHDALQKVFHSQSSQRVDAYHKQNSSSRQLTGAILVQEMVKAEFSGVMFTQHPAQKNVLFVEMVAGLAEELVSGKVRPKGYSFSLITGRLLSSEAPPIDLSPLIQLGQQIEKMFGRPQDIEWSYTNGQFLLLQSRDITASLDIGQTVREGLFPKKVFEAEKQRLLTLFCDAQPDDVVLVQDELSELLPQPTPFSLSLMEALWDSGGSTDLACQNLGLFYDVMEDSPKLFTTVFGALYVNCLEKKRRRRLNTNLFSAFRLIRGIDRLEKNYYQNFLPYFQKQVRVKEVMDLSQLETQELFELFESWRTHFIEQTYVEAQMINIATEFSLKLAERELKKRKMSPVNYLGQISETVVHQAMCLLPQIKEGKVSIHAFLDIFGHRAPYDFELAQPRYTEDPTLLKELIANASVNPYLNRSELTQSPTAKILKVVVARARKFQTLKEEVKHQSLRELFLLRRLLLELGKRFELGEDIFYLTYQELPQLKESNFQEKVMQRKEEYQQKIELLDLLNLPTQVTLKDMEVLTLVTQNHFALNCPNEKVLQGTLVAGQAPIKGQVQVITQSQEISQFEPGRILVTRFAHPTWTPLFPEAKGVITELGGWLSHAAIVAREYNILMIVGVEGVLNQLLTGDWIQINADGSIEKVLSD